MNIHLLRNHWSQCIVYWIHFQNIHTFTDEKTVLHAFLLLVFEIVESLQCILKSPKTMIYSLLDWAFAEKASTFEGGVIISLDFYWSFFMFYLLFFAHWIWFTYQGDCKAPFLKQKYMYIRMVYRYIYNFLYRAFTNGKTSALHLFIIFPNELPLIRRYFNSPEALNGIFPEYKLDRQEIRCSVHVTIENMW